VPKVVITMPAYHAEQTLERTVMAIPTGVADQLILVDDASRDATADVARGLGLQVHVHQANRGYGGNQKSCYSLALEASADIVVLLHPDYQYEPKAVPLLIAPILAGEADMTFGSRFAGMGDPLGGGMPLYRYLGNRITTVAQNAFLGTRFTDMHSGMRAYTRRCLESLPFLRYSEGFPFDAELLVDAVTSGQRVVEVPIPTRYTKESSSISISRSLDYVFKGTASAARSGVARGRRGKRYLPGWRRRGDLRGGTHRPLMVATCAGCGSERMTLVYSASATGPIHDEEFRPTTRALGRHDDILRCPRCGLISSKRGQEPEVIRDRYRRVSDPDYLAEEVERRRSFAWICDRLDSYHPTGRRLLEIGSWTGLFLEEARHRDWDVTGIEPSIWAVSRAASLGLSVSEGTIEDATAPAEPYDAIAMFDVLEHLADPLDALRRSRSFITDRGLLALTTLDATGVSARLLGARWPWFTRSHLHYFTPQVLIALLAKSGFEPVEWSNVPRRFHGSYVARRMEGWWPAAGVLEKATRFADPRLPVGWTGDVALVIARAR
jgi:2-polyprenyl-3-methyl-5-hydroxy-6-metoxy-1,4-benzoquinol methylase